jgi:acyl carrier protein
MSSREEHVLTHISSVLKRIISSKGGDLPPIATDTVLLGRDLNIDSLDLAMLVRELEETLGFDPFRDGFIEFRTVGELAQLYVR